MVPIDGERPIGGPSRAVMKSVFLSLPEIARVVAAAKHEWFRDASFNLSARKRFHIRFRLRY